jgi:hypothetical protein
VCIRDLEPIVQPSSFVRTCTVGSDTLRKRSMKMAQVLREEVNVFYIPHLRMKHLVNVYLEQVNQGIIWVQRDLCTMV